MPAKYALRGFLRALSAEAKQTRVYAVAPGYMAGGLNAGIPGAVLSFLANKSGAGVAERDDVASLVVELCTRPNAYPSGSSITVPERVVSGL